MALIRKKIEHKGLLISLFFFCPFCIYAQLSTENLYDLKFNDISNQLISWNLSGENIEVSKDSLESIDKNNPTLISSSNSIFYVPKYNFTLNQFIPIGIAVEHLQVRLTSKSDLYKKLQFKIVCLNKNEEIIGSDSIDISSNNKWGETTLKVNIKATKRLFIQITGETMRSVEFKTKNDKPKLWLDKISIMLDSVNINSQQCEDLKMNPTDLGLTTNPISLTFNNNDGFNKINDWHSAKIIGLGETVHGSETLSRSACQLIRHLVEKEDCKLVLLELPFNLVLLWDNYIQGNEDINISTEINKSKIILSPIQLIDLFKWLKYYNRNTHKKVHLVGIDITQDLTTLRRGYLYDIFDVLLKDKKLRTEVIDTLALDAPEHFYSYYKKNMILKNQLGEALYNNLLYSIKIDVQTESLGRNFLASRDSFMWKNTEYAFETYIHNKEKTVIYAHWCHLNKLNSIYPDVFKASLGNYIDKYWKSKYYVIGLLTNEGTYTNYNRNVLTDNNEISTPPENSLEYYFSMMKSDYLFARLPDFDNLIGIRLIVNKCNNSNQFQLINSKHRMDAVVYIKQSKGFEVPTIWNNIKQVDYYTKVMYQYLLNLIKLKNSTIKK